MTKLAPEWVRTSDPVIRSPARYRWTTAPAMSSLEACGLKQHIHEPTHIHGHTLDVVITRENSSTVSNTTVTDPCLCDHAGNLSKDHFALAFNMALMKPSPVQRTVTYRKLKDIDADMFRQDIRASSALQSTEGTTDSLLDAFNSELQRLIDKHAPLQTRTLVLRPKYPWFTQDLHVAKHRKRNLERKWRRSKLTVHYKMYREQCVVYNKLLLSTRSSYYQRQLEDCGRDPKLTLRTAKLLLGDRSDPILPDHSSKSDLAESFSNFFVQKIADIRAGFNATAQPDEEDIGEVDEYIPPLTHLEPATQDEITSLINNSAKNPVIRTPCPPGSSKSVCPNFSRLSQTSLTYTWHLG